VLFLRAATLTEIVVSAVSGAALAWCFRRPVAQPYAMVMIWLAWWGTGAFLTALTGIYLNPGNRRVRLRLLRDMALGPAAALVGALLVARTVIWRPVTLDYYLYAFDGSLGFQPSFALSALLQRHDWLRTLCEIAYLNLPLSMLAAYLLAGWADPALASQAIRLFLAIAAVGYVLYCVFPAAGPVFVFGADFPLHPPSLASIPLVPVRVESGPRNCMPSLHTSWCLAILWSARSLPKVHKAMLASLVGLTLIFTLTSAHYFADMVAAIPFTLAMWALTEKRLPWSHSARIPALTAGTLTFAAWLILLRFGTAFFLISPAIGWTACALTCGLCWYVPCPGLPKRALLVAVEEEGSSLDPTPGMGPDCVPNP
jgi:hypothetical protein